MPVEETNTSMNIKNRIDTIDSYEWEHFKMSKHPIFHKLNFNGYPTMFIDGIKVTSPLSKSQIKSFLDGFTQKDKII